ncbi:UDP-2,4-diacetamido-2,4,6-trideoxy-beta-L-altropyranose hydrolase [Symbiobacterium thermophilum]|uniref:UDP-2,4-diacetamido-2,4, 6-trideoxy-beta-L-altropyranose hydrolase n=1 Tax=Symbiobacterium thermophilum TaxID=2734 RepID=A0A953IAF9_SYMTR|nr:UDP-2,4-diacetamido-2,4,6-trideoxy-beta-L-altropyranose hydrolase [Symbiobacterium thermophilum]MBY6276611.1 UDP-2,4-diacetamido-2,4,6-trideoxy-beta-L-altropyranose hydrolase [Symbiobacterium thermophilum]
MNILFRVDSSFEIGTGHVMRCLTLAKMLKDAGCTVAFAMRACSGDLCDYVERQGFSVFRMFHGFDTAQETDAQLTINIIRQWKGWIDWCIVDHYQLDRRWEEQVKKYVGKMMVIDDLADRPHDCHLLLDQNYYKNMKRRYDGLVPKNCRLFLGPKYIILRPEFYEAKKSVKIRGGHVQRMLIFFGGSDPTNETEKVLQALRDLHFTHVKVDVVVGNANPKRSQIQEMCLEMNINYHCQINYIAELMAQADLSFGAGGVTMWERCFLGLPSIVTIVAENQRKSTEDAAEYGAIWNLGWHGDVKVSDYADILNRAILSPDKLTYMSEKALELIDNKEEYTVHPVIQAILEG